MHLLTPEELGEHEPFFAAAHAQALLSTCFKSRRGVVLVKDGEIIGKGYNRPPRGVEETEERCTTICRYYSLHAEHLAILEALQSGKDVHGATLYHVKMKNGEELSVNGPSCTECHKLALELGLGDMVLLLTNGWTSFSAQECYDDAMEQQYQKTRS